MTAEEIQDYRQAVYDELVRVTDGNWSNLGKDGDLKRFRHIAFDCPDEDIIGYARTNTPTEIAEFELM